MAEKNFASASAHAEMTSWVQEHFNSDGHRATPGEFAGKSFKPYGDSLTGRTHDIGWEASDVTGGVNHRAETGRPMAGAPKLAGYPNNTPAVEYPAKKRG